MGLSNQQTAWLQGFMAFFNGENRPAIAGSKRQGWDAGAASKNLPVSADSVTGGYGQKG